MEVVSRYNLPVDFPLYEMIVAWLVMDRLQAPWWVYVLVFSFYAITGFCALICSFVEVQKTPKFEEE